MLVFMEDIGNLMEFPPVTMIADKEVTVGNIFRQKEKKGASTNLLAYQNTLPASLSAKHSPMCSILFFYYT